MEAKQSQKIYSQLSISRQCPATCLGSRVSLRGAVTPEDKHLNNAHPSSSSFLLALIAECSVCGVDPLVGWGQLSWLCPLSNSCRPPAYWSLSGGVAGETALTLCEHSSAAAKALVCCQHRSSFSYKAQHYEGCCREG